MSEKNWDSAAMAARIDRVMENIDSAAQKSGRKREEITTMVVTKTRPVEQIRYCYERGFRVFGENRAQELRDKLDFFNTLGDISLHLIGHLQSNKIKYAVGNAEFIDSVDSFALAQQLDAQAQKRKVTQKIMVEVNIGDDPNKWGVRPEQTMDLLQQISELENVSVVGIMTIPPIADDETTDRLFYNMHKLFVDIQDKKIHNIHMGILSMGMSNDYEIAIKNGSNLLRIGTAFFG